MPGKRSIHHVMLECSYGNSKFGSECQQHSNNSSSMMYDSDLGFICYIHELRKKSGRVFQEYISAHCLLCSNQLLDFFFSFEQIEHGEWCPRKWRFPHHAWIQYLAGAVDCRLFMCCIFIASHWTKLLFSDPRNLVDRPRYMAIFVCRSGSRCSVVLITNIPLCL